MIVHVNSDDLELLLNQLITDLEGIEDRNDPFLRDCEKVIERVRRKINQAEAREDRKMSRELIKANEKKYPMISTFCKRYGGRQ